LKGTEVKGPPLVQEPSGGEGGGPGQFENARRKGLEIKKKKALEGRLRQVPRRAGRSNDPWKRNGDLQVSEESTIGWEIAGKTRTAPINVKKGHKPRPDPRGRGSLDPCERSIGYGKNKPGKLGVGAGGGGGGETIRHHVAN